MNEKFQIISLLILLPVAGSVLLALLRHDSFARVIALITTAMSLVASGFLYIFFDKKTHSFQLIEGYLWLPQWSIRLDFAVDGISAPFILLIALVSFAAVILSWNQIRHKETAYYINILLLQSIMVGLFTSTNLIQFFIFWEAMLIPLFLLIGLWGGTNARYASWKFLLFTFGGSIFMFVAIISLYFMGFGGLDLTRLSGIRLSFEIQSLLFWAFLIAFAVKIPIFPLHSWLPDTYYEAPTAVTTILSAVLAKMGSYGVIRIAIPLFPEATVYYSGILITLSIATIIYGAYSAMIQTDLKKLVAYSSMSHMGFIALGIFALNRAGIEGSLMQMINHAIVTGGMFLCVGMLQERTGITRMDAYGKLALKTPFFVIVFTIFALAGTGFPGLNYFIGEFLVLSGAFESSLLIGSLAVLGVLLGVTYMSCAYYRVILKKYNVEVAKIKDITAMEYMMLTPFVIATFFFGVQPQALLSYFHRPVSLLIERLSGYTQTFTMLMETLR
ncbi:MAG: NADH-quinone oxidoreductase subunit M [Thermodesulfovibrionales bacterium]|nr:NADH-quinone oxidoreductase subunit M [Thermodesulfovibrionales bacterium]